MDKPRIQLSIQQPVGVNIPDSRPMRDALRDACMDYVRREHLIAPLALETLKSHAGRILQHLGQEARYLDFAVVILNNELCRSALARIPYDRRLLLLPRCLRDDRVCRGEFDEIGLLCRRCGACVIDALTDHAQKLGYSVLVAEGSPVVMGLLQAGGIEAVVGVSCLPMLEKVFPYMEAAAFPGVAVPLLYDGCQRTAFDVDWLMDYMEERDDGSSGSLSISRLRQTVQRWFEPSGLQAILGVPGGPVETAGQNWLALAGKRWRPMLAAGAWSALTQQPLESESIRRACIAVECFHKASLIHDDIEDGDEFRYGHKTLHAEIGIPSALNAGDYLIGLGYQLLAALDIHSDTKVAMLAVAADGHRILCLGQGAELEWVRRKNPLSSAEVLKIFEQKTVPAFEVALKLGAIHAGADAALLEILGRFSRYVGLAYQIRDDLLDWISADSTSDTQTARLSMLKAIALEKAADCDKAVLADIWCGNVLGIQAQERCRELFEKYQVQAEARSMLQAFGSQARQTLDAITHAALKGFLRKLLAKILDEVEEIKCCEDHSPRHD